MHIVAILFLAMFLGFAWISYWQGDRLLAAGTVFIGLMPISVDTIGGKTGDIVGVGIFSIAVIIFIVRIFLYIKNS